MFLRLNAPFSRLVLHCASERVCVFLSPILVSLATQSLPSSRSTGSGRPKEKFMETIIGVYDSRDRAEAALKDLLAKNVPVDSIVYLTRSESEAHNFAKEVGGFAGGFLGGTVGMAASAAAIGLALFPGVGQVYALGAGATALMGYL